jgi:phosphohistidine phosphatase
MLTLLLMRHAKSDWSDDRLADFDRPLNKRGLRDASRMAGVLNQHRIGPQLVLSSPASRARTTADLLLTSLAQPCELILRPELYHAETATWLRVVAELPDHATCVLAIGHNPELEALLARWLGEPVRLATAAIAHLRAHVAHWQEVDESTDVELCDLWRPKDF